MRGREGGGRERGRERGRGAGREAETGRRRYTDEAYGSEINPHTIEPTRLPNMYMETSMVAVSSLSHTKFSCKGSRYIDRYCESWTACVC